MRALVAIVLLFCCSSCAFINRANEFKARGRFDLLAPISWIPGIDSILPHIVLDLSGGFEWHSDEERHQREIELLKVKASLPKELKEDEVDLEEVFLRALGGGDVPPKLRDLPKRDESSPGGAEGKGSSPDSVSR